MKIIIALIIMLLITGCGSIGDTLAKDALLHNVDTWNDETFIPNNYSFTTPNTMLVLGNSIALIPDYGYGASASSIDNDYVHVLARLISTNVTVRNCWDIEKGYKTFDYNILPTADLIIIQLGDNLKDDGPNYSIHLSRIIDRYQGKDVILVSTVLKSLSGSKPINNQIKAVAIQYNIPFIDVRECMWLSPEHTGEVRHPSDLGMDAIANKIYKEVM